MPNTKNSPLPSDSNQIDILTIGDSSIDLYLKVPNDQGMIEDDPNATQDKMCFFHGTKIAVESFKTTVAGNSVNVGIGTKLLGLNSAVYTETGDDANADRIIEELKRTGVNITYTHKDVGTETDLHAVIVFNGERTIFSYHGHRKYSIQNWPTPKFIYYTSMSDGFGNFQTDLIDYVKKNKIGLFFNPGTIHMKAGIEALKDVLSVTDVLLVNTEEAVRLTGIESFTDLRALHKGLREFGPKVTVITDGAKGASADDGTKFIYQKAYKDPQNRQIVDKTGAGDAFSSAFVAALFYGKDIKEALKWGAVNSSCVIRVIGATHGLLEKPEIEDRVKKFVEL